MTRAADDLCEIHAADTRVEVLETRCCALADFGTRGLHAATDDVVAGVMSSFQGNVSGTALFVMEPEHALAWSRADGAGQDPLACYVDIAGRMIFAVVEGAGVASGSPVRQSEARLEESSLAGCLLKTHAPSDTMIVSTQLRIHAGGQAAPAFLYVLLEPKLIGALLSSLVVDTV